MAITTADTFYMGLADQDQAFGLDVRALQTTAPGAIGNSQNNHGTTANQTEITTDPFTVSTATTDRRIDYGWALNEAAASADSAGSVAGARRVIPDGAWSFAARVNIPVAGTTTGSITVFCRWSVYRVAAGGGTRTLLFSAQSGTAASTGLSAANNQDLTVTTGSQAAIILEPGETIHVALSTNSRQVAGLAGATVQQSIVVQMPFCTVIVPAPGIRTVYQQASAVTGVAGAAHAAMTRKTLQVAGVATAALSRLIGVRLPVTGAAVATTTKTTKPIPYGVMGTPVATTIKQAFVTGAVTGAAVASTLRKSFVTGAVTGAAVAAFDRRLEATRAFLVQGVAVATFGRAIIAVRAFAVTGVAVADLYVKIGQAALNRLAGGAVTVVKRVLHLTDD